MRSNSSFIFPITREKIIADFSRPDIRIPHQILRLACSYWRGQAQKNRKVIFKKSEIDDLKRQFLAKCRKPTRKVHTKIEKFRIRFSMLKCVLQYPSRPFTEPHNQKLIFGQVMQISKFLANGHFITVFLFHICMYCYA